MPAPQNQPPTFKGNSLHGASEQLVVRTSSPSQRPIEAEPAAQNYGNTNAFMSLGLFVLALSLFLFKYLKGREKPLSLARDTQFSHQNPCSKCRFFNKNPYLQCAVHPENFGRIHPKDCPDFWAVDQDEFLTK